MKLQQRIKEILDSGINQVDLAEKLECSQPTISFLLNDEQRTVKFELGLRILELHKKINKRKQ